LGNYPNYETYLKYQEYLGEAFVALPRTEQTPILSMIQKCEEFLKSKKKINTPLKPSRSILVSVLIPSRGNVSRLSYVVENYIQLADSPHKIEIIVRFDNDDLETMELFQEFVQKKNYNIKCMSGPRFGYLKLHEYFNEMATIASGKLLLPTGDDNLIITPLWDKQLLKHLQTNKKVLKPAVFRANKIVKFCMFFLNREIYNILGHIATTPLIDNWVGAVIKNPFPALIGDVDILFLSDPINNPLEDKANNLFHSKANRKKMIKDTSILLNNQSK